MAIIDFLKAALLPSSIIASLLSLAVSGPAVAADPAKPTDKAPAKVGDEPNVTTAAYGDWLLRCVRLPAGAAIDGKAVTGRSCEVVQTVKVQGQNDPVAQLAIGRLPNDPALHLTALLPANIALPGLVRISGNGKSGAEEQGALALNWTRCIGGGCFAEGKLDDAKVKTLRGLTTGQLQFLDAGGKAIGIPLSWTGLDQALNALDKAM